MHRQQGKAGPLELRRRDSGTILHTGGKGKRDHWSSAGGVTVLFDAETERANGTMELGRLASNII